MLSRRRPPAFPWGSVYGPGIAVDVVRIGELHAVGFRGVEALIAPHRRR